MAIVCFQGLLPEVIFLKVTAPVSGPNGGQVSAFCKRPGQSLDTGPLHTWEGLSGGTREQDLGTGGRSASRHLLVQTQNSAESTNSNSKPGLQVIVKVYGSR